MIHTIGYGTVNGMMTVRAVARAAERDAVNDLIDQIAGTMLTVSRKILFGLADLALRRLGGGFGVLRPWHRRGRHRPQRFDHHAGETLKHYKREMREQHETSPSNVAILSLRSRFDRCPIPDLNSAPTFEQTDCVRLQFHKLRPSLAARAPELSVPPHFVAG